MFIATAAAIYSLGAGCAVIIIIIAMIQDVNAAFFPKSVRVKLLNCYTVAAPQSLRPAYVGTLSRPVNESSSRTSKGVYETSHNRSGLRGDCSTPAAARRRHSGGQDDPSRRARRASPPPDNWSVGYADRQACRS